MLLLFLWDRGGGILLIWSHSQWGRTLLLVSALNLSLQLKVFGFFMSERSFLGSYLFLREASIWNERFFLSNLGWVTSREMRLNLLRLIDTRSCVRIQRCHLLDLSLWLRTLMISRVIRNLWDRASLLECDTMLIGTLFRRVDDILFLLGSPLLNFILDILLNNFLNLFKQHSY